jgi:hypothetical protein
MFVISCLPAYRHRLKPATEIKNLLMKVYKINQYWVGAGLAGKELNIHLNLVSRQSRPPQTYYDLII